jgi:hypothetical protein
MAHPSTPLNSQAGGASSSPPTDSLRHPAGASEDRARVFVRIEFYDTMQNMD